MGLSSETRFGFGYTVRLWVLVCTFGKALRIKECAIVFGSCSFRESREKSGSTVRSTGRSWKPGGGKVIVFLLVSRECSRGRDSHGVVWCLMDGYEVFVDIYSCDRP